MKQQSQFEKINKTDKTLDVLIKGGHWERPRQGQKKKRKKIEKNKICKFAKFKL